MLSAKEAQLSTGGTPKLWRQKYRENLLNLRQRTLNLDSICLSSTGDFHASRFWKYTGMKLEWHQTLSKKTKFNSIWAMIQLINIVGLKFKL